MANNHDESYDGYRFDPVFAARVRDFFQASLAPLLPSRARILDVGCGAGEFVQAAVQAGHDASGIDISPDAITICRAKGVPARCADFLRDEVGRDLDLITFWDVMEHLVEPAPFLRRAHDLLRPGGFLFAKIPFFGTMSLRLAQHHRFAGPLLGAPDHIQYYSERSIRALCERTGFDPDLQRGPGMREPSRGGSTLKQAKRALIAKTKAVSNDGNLYLFARKAAG